ncbi:MAG TPA: ABC transporter ATP-binding protein [Chloroflexi bacterium]|nr:ABC transporter ATP-binding protein [Chloroflexota bacterium]
MAEIRIEGVRKTFGKVKAVWDVSLTVHDREFVVLLGPSGCGKTTLLRCIAGLEQVDQGRVFIGQRDVTDLAPKQRQIAMVFQNYAVFPHLTVFENIAFGLRMQRKPKDEIKKRVLSAAELLHIEDLLDRYPAQLSGGQRQRVAVARAIAVDALVLLMDEPLSNLDALLRLEMRAELKRLLREVQATTIYVTHDQVEAMSLGDRIAVMKDGQILQYDTPLNVYDKPANLFIGGFIGNPPMNFLEGRLQEEEGQIVVQVGNSQIRPSPEVQALLRRLEDRSVLVGIRAENIDTLHTPADDTLPAEVLVVEPLGSHNLITVQVGPERIKVNTDADFKARPGETLWLRFNADKIRWIDKASGQALDYKFARPS